MGSRGLKEPKILRSTKLRLLASAPPLNGSPDPSPRGKDERRETTIIEKPKADVVGGVNGRWYFERSYAG